MVGKRHIDGLGARVEQPQGPPAAARRSRAAGQSADVAAARFCCGGEGQSAGALRNMRVLRQGARPRVFLRSARRCGRSARPSWSLSWDIALSRSRCCCTTISVRLRGERANEIEAEAGIEGIAQRIEPLPEQAIDHRAARHRLAGHRRPACVPRRRCGKKEARLQPPARPLPCFSHRGDQGSRRAATMSPRITTSVATGSATSRCFDDVIRQRFFAD